ncbi:uncharacterized protein F5891DRAFT_990939 [Suillus fuscotomentosus]|uniref:Uncharacterized protein n=1 Tax=Suillus fuscotomentosus TaxID=1912939 RepID=A0AAD4HAN5_9AGAM|nr:uncharacterized protein F5891DRAFT_990939 [Suillus fuscotomentosus]KAG1883203.1 hypothetical protein F5891DRAFT_990939 [Suillus fuscotomentosus]
MIAHNTIFVTLSAINPFTSIGGLSRSIIVDAIEFLSRLEGLIEGSYEPSRDRFNADDDGDHTTQAVNMRVRRRIGILSNGLHEMMSDAFDMFDLAGGSVDQINADEYDVEFTSESTIETRRNQRREALYTRMQNARLRSRNIWAIVRLAKEIKEEAAKVVDESSAWDDDMAEGRDAYVCERMRRITACQNKAKIAAVSILKHWPTHWPAIGGTQVQWMTKRGEKRQEGVWQIIDMCRRSLEELEEIILHSADW